MLTCSESSKAWLQIADELLLFLESLHFATTRRGLCLLLPPPMVTLERRLIRKQFTLQTYFIFYQFNEVIPVLISFLWKVLQAVKVA